METFKTIGKAIRMIACLSSAGLFFSGTTASAQVNEKRAVTPDNYHRWGRLGAPAIAPDAGWVAFSMDYEDGRDTLFVMSTKGKKDYILPAASFGAFSRSGWLSYRKNGALTLLNPKTGDIRSLGAISDCTFSKNGRYCIFERKEGERRNLCRLDLQDIKVDVIDSTSGFAYNGIADAVVYATGHDVRLLRLGKKSKSVTLHHGTDETYSNIGWQDKGNAFAFLVNKNNSQGGQVTSAGFYDVISGRYFGWEIGGEAGMEGKQIASIPKLKISADGQRIFVPLVTPLISDLPAAKGPQLWNASSKEIYPRQQVRLAQQRTDMWVWWPHQDKYRPVTDSIFIEMALSGDQRYALLWDPRQNEPHPNLSALIDYYAYDLNTGQKELLLQKQSPAEITVLTSPGGRYVAYFRERHWYTYDFKRKVHTCLTANLGTAFFKEDFDWPEDAPPYGNPGWTENDGEIILYDKFDIWLVHPDGTQVHRITKGREEQLSYRICLTSGQRNNVNYDGLQNGIFRTGGPYVLKGKSSRSVTYSRWESTSGITPLLSSGVDLTSEAFTENGDLAAIEQSYAMSPRIVVRTNGSKSNILYSSNHQLDSNPKGGVHLVSYSNSKGIPLKGTLYYPVNYNPDKKYPMIVHIYQKQALDHNRYILPTLSNVSGFNIKHLSLAGYFVFLPDITYEMGSPGNSALDCVTAAVKAALEVAPVDAKKIGLIGHSFGGYETNYIISHTDIFAVAVSGAAINDLTSFYHYVVPGFERPNFWFMEHGQFRMAEPFFANRKGYLDNSPLYNAQGINTPLLTWAGDADPQVHYFQMISLHLALRRLGKVNYALLYPGQGHIITDPDFQKDLTLRISDWFGYYLNNGPMPSWMTP
jgi:dipeptidyl aminopeptidase/acylaminoacyl peptidase